MLHHEKVKGQNLFGQRFYKKKIFVGSKKLKNIYLNSSVANTDRPVISKTNRFEENLNDANRSFENNKECSNAIQSVKKHRLQKA